MIKKQTSETANDYTIFSRISIKCFYTMQNAHMAPEKAEKTRKKPISGNAIRVYSTYIIMVIYLSYMSK
jgi:hypothetical protein